MSNNRLYIGDWPNKIWVYSLPLTSASTPSQTLTDSSDDGIFDLAADPSGTIYATTQPGAIDVFPPGATSPSFSLSGSTVQNPRGLTIDSGGNLFINNNNANVGYFAAPVHSGEAGFTFPRQPFISQGIATDSCDNLYAVGNFLDTGGWIDVYHPPYSPASMRVSKVNFPASNLHQMQIASDGMMYIATADSILVLAPPYKGVSLSLNYPGNVYWVAVGP